VPASTPASSLGSLAPIEISAERLTKAFGEKIVLNSVDLTIRSGEIVCIVGMSGSGKTVLLDTLTGLLGPTSGRILAADHNRAPSLGDAVSQPPLIDLAEADDETLDRIRLHWAVVFQHNALFSGTVRDNLALWLREHTRLTESDIATRIRAALAAVALDPDDVLNKDRSSLSGGMAKRVAIARAIACDPLVIFYDEPTTGLDPIVGGAVHELIWKTHHLPAGEGFQFRDLEGLDLDAAHAARKNARRTTIIVTHDRELLRRLRPRVVMLDDRKICFDGPYDQFGTTDCPPAVAYLAHMPVLHGRTGT
jgi:phospholipid/cholesterol/gamma-HCH transport system ATP-binding protein